jgi:hypothetical protein
MALFSYNCPKCGRRSLINPQGACQIQLKNGSTCGYQLPFTYDLGNRKFQEKVDKHTGPPPASLPSEKIGTWSWVDEKDKYSLYHEQTLVSGSVNLDLQNNYFFLWHTPSGSNAIAHVMYGDAGTVVSASGVVSPLNSKIQNFHSHFSNWDNDWTPIAAGQNLIIEEPSQQHPDIYTVSLDGYTKAWFNPTTKKFWNDK